MTYFVPQTLEDILEMQERGDSENATLEFKSCRLFAQKNEKIFETLSREITAFSNSIGGVLIIGVEEDTDRRISEIVPITDSKKHEAWIEDGLLSRITPSLHLTIARIEVDEGHLLVINVPPSRAAPHQSADKRFYARRLFRVDPLLSFEVDDIRRRAAAMAGGANLSVLFQGGAISFAIENEGLEAIFDVWIDVKGIENSDIAKVWTPGLGRPYTEPFRIIHPGERRNFLGAGFDFFEEQLDDRMDVTLNYTDDENVVHGITYTYYLKDFHSTARLRTPHEELLDQGIKKLEKLERALSDLARDIREIRECAFHPTGLNLSKTTLSVLAGEEGVKWPGEALTFQALAELLEVDFETAIKIQQEIFGATKYVGGKNTPLGDAKLPEQVKEKILQQLALPPESLNSKK
ncbi:ATP-binding protein [Paroceanicella profunda]|uniref:ATP-binding protein n=1 Tax=Paroceanicella profunda TaxID=2579971 RepID=A0A5B8FRU2_9RHOB|nr:ATP-binding protein [Paroceanicella profunda]QDL91085.1 ATP-binding protein [Paroceanicella profunda]